MQRNTYRFSRCFVSRAEAVPTIGSVRPSATVRLRITPAPSSGFGLFFHRLIPDDPGHDRCHYLHRLFSISLGIVCQLKPVFF
jgi:hypothetical protein